MNFRWVVIAVTCAMLFFAPRARAWSSKEHIQLTRIAAERLVADPTTPPAMKEWLGKHVQGLTDMAGEKEYLLHKHIGMTTSDFNGVLKYVIRPDDHARDAQGPKIPEFNAPEKQMHFIDLEMFLPNVTTFAYRSDLSGRPKFEDFPHDASDPRYVRAGFLPLRVEYCYKKLVESIRAGRRDGSLEMLENEEDSAPRWAGYLAHYLEDNTQPHHATEDYKSASYFSNKRKAPDVHAQIEYKMIDDEKDEHAALRAEFWPLFAKALDDVQDPIDTEDLFKATLQVSLSSYEALPMIGDAAVAAYKPTPGNRPDDLDSEVFFRHTGTYHGQQMTVMQMKANQLAWAVKRVQREWKRAWEEANAPTTAPASSVPAAAP
jgi:hypothetical protein